MVARVGRRAALMHGKTSPVPAWRRRVFEGLPAAHRHPLPHLIAERDSPAALPGDQRPGFEDGTNHGACSNPQHRHLQGVQFHRRSVSPRTRPVRACWQFSCARPAGSRHGTLR